MTPEESRASVEKEVAVGDSVVRVWKAKPLEGRAWALWGPRSSMLKKSPAQRQEAWPSCHAVGSLGPTLATPTGEHGAPRCQGCGLQTP